MTRDKKIILISILVAVVLLVGIGVTFGWFVDGYLSDRFSFAVAFVESKVTLYRAEDNNKDGVVELDENGAMKFTVLGDSENGSVILDSNGMPVIDSAGNPTYDKSKTVRFDIDGILPTQVYTWKVAIQNVGDVRAKIFADIIIPSGGVVGGGIDVLSYAVNDRPIIYSANCYENNADTHEVIQKIRLVDGDAVDYKTERPEDEGRSINEYIIAVRFMTRDELKNIGVELTNEQYMAYMSRVVGSISMSVRLEDNK